MDGEPAPRDDGLSRALRAAVVQRRAAPAAIEGTAHTRVIQRTEESAALLAKLATPAPRKGPAVPVQKALVKALDVDHATDFAGPIINLGGILIEQMPEKDADVLEQAEFVPLPTAGGFVSSGGARGAKVEAHGLGAMVLENTLKTMIDAKQIEYLRLAGLPNDDWKILVEVHYFRERDMAATGMHKDTLGETLFVNLNYHMDKKVIGPEIVVNPPKSPAHDAQVKGSLPKEFRKDLKATRAQLGDPTEIQTSMVDAYGYVAFVDEAVHHATPLYGHRRVTGLDLRQYLQATWPAAFAEAEAEYPTYATRPWKHYFSWFSSYVDNAIISPPDSQRWLRRMEIVTNAANHTKKYTRVDLKAAMSDAEFDALLEAVSIAKPGERTQGAPAGFYAASIPVSGPSDIRGAGKPVLKRRLSNADFRKTLPPEPVATEKRRFFRTWVRAIKTAKADDLHRRVREAKATTV
jgi:hypothetical protein